MMVSNNKLAFIIMILTTVTLVFSILPAIPTSNYYEANGSYDIDYPFFGDGQGEYAGTHSDSVNGIDNPSNYTIVSIIFVVLLFQLFGWFIFLYYYSIEKEAPNRLIPISLIRNVQFSYLISVGGYIVWFMQLISKDDEYSVKWGLDLLLFLNLFAAGLSYLLYGRLKLTKPREREESIDRSDSIENKDQSDRYDDPLESSVIDEIEEREIVEPKISRRKRKEIEKAAREEENRIAVEEAELIRKSELENLIRERIETFQKIVTRSAKLKIEQLGDMLDMEQKELLKWLYDLPDEFGFVINEDIIEFDTIKIGDSIERLLADFENVDRTKDGKL